MIQPKKVAIDRNPFHKPNSKILIILQNTYIIYKFLTMKILKISTITVAVLVAVFIIIACIFPPIAKNYINKHSKELIGRQINIKGLYINIFTGYARITDFQLLEANDLDTFVSFDTLSVDMSLHRLLANEVRINHISLTNPSVKVLQQGSEFNFDDLWPRVNGYVIRR